MTYNRDFILIVGPSGAGKTRAVRGISQFCSENNIPFQLPPLSDARTLYNHILEDDRNGGRNHIHPWCITEDSHTHTGKDTPTLPFTVTVREPSYDIGSFMYADFFNSLATEKPQGLGIAELSYGVNGNPVGDPAHLTDFSALTMTQRLRSGVYNPDGLRRIFAVIHVYADFKTRMFFNKYRSNYPPTQNDMDLGLASWGLDDRAMRIFQGDDFNYLEVFFQNMEMNPRIVTVRNEGTNQTPENFMRPIFETVQLWTHRNDGESTRSHGVESEF